MNNAERLAKDLALIKKGTLELIGEDDLKEKLCRYYDGGKPLVIKLGLDPSAPDIHLGHTVVLRKIRQFQSIGHKAMIIIGDFTGRIGDPTGKSKTRKQLTTKEVLKNADTYRTQLLKILDPENTIICFNGEWLDDVSLKDMIEFMSKQSLQRILERDSFKKRMNNQETIYMHELLYPMIQGLDSVNIEADVELGGMDQKFNILMGRDMQGKENMEKQVAILMPIIEGLDGVEKMSKSLDNYIGVTDSPEMMVNKVMSIPDELIEKYFNLLTDELPERIDEIMMLFASGKMHPKDVKMILATTIARTYHTPEKVEAARINFINVFTKKQLPKEIESVEIAENTTICEAVVKAGFAKSKSEARRLVIQKGVKLNQEIIVDTNFSKIGNNAVLQVGKKRFIQLTVS